MRTNRNSFANTGGRNIFYTVSMCQERYEMGKSAFWNFRKSLGLIKRRNDFFTDDEIRLMDVAVILRWAGCGSKVLTSFQRFWESPQAPINFKERVEQFLQNYQVSLVGLWKKLPAKLKVVEPARFFQQLIGDELDVQAE